MGVSILLSFNHIVVLQVVVEVTPYVCLPGTEGEFGVFEIDGVIRLALASADEKPPSRYAVVAPIHPTIQTVGYRAFVVHPAVTVIFM